MSDTSDFDLKFTELEKRIQSIEDKLNIKSKTPTSPIDKQQDPYSINQSHNKLFMDENPSNFSGKGMGYIAGLCFILAASFTIKMAIDSGWLTPMRQVVISALFGFLLICSGFIVRKIDQKYASFLPGIGIGILYLSTFGGHLYYKIISLPITFVILVVISLTSIYLVKYYRYSFFLLASLLGAYLTPLLLARENINFNLIGLYFIIWSVTYGIISAKLVSRVLHSISCYAGLGVLCLISLGYSNNISYSFIIIQFIQFLLFSTGIIYHSTINKSAINKSEMLIYMPVLMFFYATEYSALNTMFPIITPWIALGFAGLLIILQRLSANLISQPLNASKDVIWSFSALVIIHAGYYNLLPPSFEPWVLFILIGLLSIFTNNNVVKQIIDTKFIPALLLLVFGLEYIQALISIIDYSYKTLLNSALVSFGFATILAIHSQASKSNNKMLSKEQGLLVLTFAHIQAVSALYSIFNNQGSLAVSISWSLYALLILSFAFCRKDQDLGRSSIFVIAVAALKVFFYDLSDSEPAIRIICLLITGALLYLGGLILRKISNWSDN